MTAPLRTARAIARGLLVLVVSMTWVAHADTNPKRKVVVLEYRSNSAGLPGVGKRMAQVLRTKTSLVVLGIDQTRALYGEHLDQVIVKCAGEAECVARIGAKVGAAEVILVGVSELGDVILTMQRIDVGDHKVVARVAESLASGASPSDEQIDGYLTKLMPPTDFLRFGIIDIIASQDGAAVTVGGKSRGLTPIQPLKLRAPASYDIRVEKSGFVPFSTRVELPPDGKLKVEAELSKQTKPAWYQHWYVLTAAGVLVAGAAGTTIYFATQSSSDRVPLNGTIP